MIRAFYVHNTESTHPDMPNSDLSEMSDEAVVAMYDALVKDTEDMLMAMKRANDTHPGTINTGGWIWQLVELQDALLENILLGG
jgi:hypothetical protein